MSELPDATVSQGPLTDAPGRWSVPDADNDAAPLQPLPNSLAAAARAIVTTAETLGKVRLAHQTADAWNERRLSLGNLSTAGSMPERPGRPARPELLPPRAMPRRSAHGLANRIALLHSLAHIELNAVDMTWDLIGRFAHVPMPRAFFDDWVLSPTCSSLLHKPNALQEEQGSDSTVLRRELTPWMVRIHLRYCLFHFSFTPHNRHTHQSLSKATYLSCFVLHIILPQENTG